MVQIESLKSTGIYAFKTFHAKFFYNLFYRLVVTFHKNPWKFITMRRFVMFPRKRRINTVLRSTHTDKKSREQFELLVCKRVFFCKFENFRNTSNLLTSSGFRKYFISVIPTGIGMTEKIATYLKIKNI